MEYSCGLRVTLARGKQSPFREPWGDFPASFQRCRSHLGWLPVEGKRRSPGPGVPVRAWPLLTFGLPGATVQAQALPSRGHRQQAQPDASLRSGVLPGKTEVVLLVVPHVFVLRYLSASLWVLSCQGECWHTLPFTRPGSHVQRSTLTLLVCLFARMGALGGQSVQPLDPPGRDMALQAICSHVLLPLSFFK